MKEKPILFNTEMVTAILSGKKTTTRRLIKRKYSNTHLEMFTNKYGTRLIEKQNDVEGETHGKNEDGTSWHKLLWMREIEDKAPYKIGDIIYVRETWKIQSMSNVDKRVKFMYKTKGDKDLETRFVTTEKYEKLLKYECKNGWQPSLFMPKEAARIFLKVTDVRVQRLQDIDDEGAKSEGSNVGIGIAEKMKEGAIDRFERIWDSTVNKKDIEQHGWNANPFVWVIEFERIDKEEF